jgi:histidinol-phosphate aminotransferase
MARKSALEKGGFPSGGINLALCENPLPPLKEAVEAAQAEMPLSNHYTEPYSSTLKEHITDYVKVPSENIHINAGSELILRQLFALYGKKVHLISPTYYLFEEIAQSKTRTALNEIDRFLLDMEKLVIPDDTTLAVIVNPNNPTGALFDIKKNTSIIEKHPGTMFLVDEAFIEFGGTPATELVLRYDNIIITRTFSKAFSLAGCRIGYAVASTKVADYLNTHNDAYPLSRSSEAAAIASLDRLDQIKERVFRLRKMAQDISSQLEDLDFVVYPTETFFFLTKIPSLMNADEFAERMAKEKIRIRPLYLPGYENQFVRFATSTKENNLIVLEAVLRVLSS